MIQGDPNAPHVTQGSRATLDDIFRGDAARHAERIALGDAINRSSFTDFDARRLTYRDADRVIGAIAGRLRRLGIPPDSVVALQLPNTVESVLALLGVLRAGMIAAPIPLLWRRAEMVTALGRLGAKAIITNARVADFDFGALATDVAAELFAIRHVLSFGRHLADGLLPLDDLFEEGTEGALLPLSQVDNPAAHVAVVTWEITPQGPVAMARSHNELLAGGVAVLLEGAVPRDATIVSPCPLSSFAALSMGMLPWLLSAGSLLLHQPFDPDVFAIQCRDERCDTVILPGPLVARCAEAGLLAGDDLRSVLALWRAPEQLASAPYCRRDGVHLTDVLTFGETGLVATRRDAAGRPKPVPLGAMRSPRGGASGTIVAELSTTTSGSLAFRGPMVPRHPFPPGIDLTDAPRFPGGAQAPVDTGYACRIDDGGGIALTRPPAGVVGVGGYRFVLRELEKLIADTDRDASFTPLPDTLMSNRLAGEAPNRAALRAVLAINGANALVTAAFQDGTGTAQVS